MASIPKYKACPQCHNQVPLPASDMAASEVICPHCGVSLQLRRRADCQHAIKSQPPPLPTAPPLPPQSATQQDTIPYGIPVFGEYSDHRNGDPSLLDQTDGPLPLQRSDSATGPSLFTNPRWLRRLLYFGIWLGPLSIFFLAAISPTDSSHSGQATSHACAGICMGVTWLAIGCFIARLVSWALTMLLVKEIKCPGCGELHPAVNHWTCGCGYRPPAHKRCHVLAAKCPLCQKAIGWFSCQVCDTTVMVR